MRIVLQIVFLVGLALAIIDVSQASSSSSKSNRRCRRLPTLSNGNVEQNGNQINYGCSRGFMLQVTGVCRRRSWRPIVSCEEIICNAEPVIANGSLDSTITSRNVDAEYSFTCNAGFKGNGSVKCNWFGIWEVSGNCEECFVKPGEFLFPEDKILQITVADKNCTIQDCLDRNITGCVTPISSGSSCTLLSSPIIFGSNSLTLDECNQTCIADSSCKLFSYSPILPICLFFDSLPGDDSDFISEDPNAITVENCQIIA